MLRDLKKNNFADVYIKTDFELLKTAQIVAEIFGGLAIEKDDGHYEEYPAYLGRDASAGFKFALLGIPEAKYEIRENPHPDYHLIVEPIEADDDAYTESVAEQVAKAINEDGRLRANHI